MLKCIYQLKIINKVSYPCAINIISVRFLPVAGVRCDPCGAMRWTVYGWSQVECSVLAISKRGFVSPICCSLINTFFWWNVFIYRLPNSPYVFLFDIEWKVHMLVFYPLLNWKMQGETLKFGYALIYAKCFESCCLVPAAALS